MYRGITETLAADEIEKNSFSLNRTSIKGNKFFQTTCTASGSRDDELLVKHLPDCYSILILSSQLLTSLLSHAPCSLWVLLSLS